MPILVTGRAGLIGANFVNDWLNQLSEPVINLDNLSSLKNNPNHDFVHVDIGDSKLILCDILDYVLPKADGSSYKPQITFVDDRADNHKRYAIDARKIKHELN